MPNGELASAEQIKDDCDAWKTSFARDQRGSFIQNHDHDCTGTCVKYQKKKNAAEFPQRAGQKIAGPGVPKCRFRFFRFVALLIGGMLKYVIRRGKELVKQAFIATGNEENEYGKAIVPRQSPFRSSSSDVLQSTLRCNADYQYQKRAVPDLQMGVDAEYEYQMRAEADYQKKIASEGENQYQKTSTEQRPSAADPKQSTDSHNFTASFLSGCGAFKTRTNNQCQQLLIMTTIATAMRAANVADFYMTKY